MTETKEYAASLIVRFKATDIEEADEIFDGFIEFVEDNEFVFDTATIEETVNLNE